MKMINDQTMEPHDSTTQLGVQTTARSTKSVKIVPLKKPLIQWRRKMIQEGGALVNGCSKSDAIWASFMGSFAILGGPSPPPPPFLRLFYNKR